ncbi:MAG: ABC transporter permease subunit [Bacteroidales bacterium]|nr:ABC transporter permease subunit [Bacteroidales bacterium]
MNKTRHIFRILAAALTLSGILSCASRGEAPLEIRSEAELAGLTVSCTSGNYYERSLSKRGDLTVFACNSDADAIQAVRQGRADVFVTDEVVMTESAMDRLGLKMALRGEDIFDVAFAMQKGDTALEESMNAFLGEAPLEGIVEHWLKGTPDPAWNPEREDSGKAPLRCIVCMNMEPVCFMGDGGEWMGLEPDILKRFCRETGRSLKFSFQDLGSAIMALESGQADIVASSLFVTEERKNFVDFSEPYYQCHPAYFVKESAGKGGNGLWSRIKMSLVTESRWKLITGGLLETIKITLLSILFGTLLGAGVCAAKRSRRKWLRDSASLYGMFIQGIPTLVLLLIMFYVVFSGSGIGASAVAVVTFALCFASASGNIFDTSISSVHKGQTEAGLSLGFTPLQTFTGIVLPQALKKGLPLYRGECVSLLKSTSIVGYIAIQDLTRASDLIRSRTFDALIPLLIVTAIYFLLAWLIRLSLNLLLPKE